MDSDNGEEPSTPQLNMTPYRSGLDISVPKESLPIPSLPKQGQRNFGLRIRQVFQKANTTREDDTRSESGLLSPEKAHFSCNFEPSPLAQARPLDPPEPLPPVPSHKKKRFGWTTKVTPIQSRPSSTTISTGVGSSSTSKHPSQTTHCSPLIRSSGTQARAALVSVSSLGPNAGSAAATPTATGPRPSFTVRRSQNFDQAQPTAAPPPPAQTTAGGGSRRSLLPTTFPANSLINTTVTEEGGERNPDGHVQHSTESANAVVPKRRQLIISLPATGEAMTATSTTPIAKLHALAISQSQAMQALATPTGQPPRAAHLPIGTAGSDPSASLPNKTSFKASSISTPLAAPGPTQYNAMAPRPSQGTNATSTSGPGGSSRHPSALQPPPSPLGSQNAGQGTPRGQSRPAHAGGMASPLGQAPWASRSALHSNISRTSPVGQSAGAGSTGGAATMGGFAVNRLRPSNPRKTAVSVPGASPSPRSHRAPGARFDDRTSSPGGPSKLSFVLRSFFRRVFRSGNGSSAAGTASSPGQDADPTPRPGNRPHLQPLLSALVGPVAPSPRVVATPPSRTGQGPLMEGGATELRGPPSSPPSPFQPARAWTGRTIPVQVS